MNEQDLKLPALIDRAQRCLAGARTSAEVLEARAAAQAALHYAKLVKAAHETQADCLKMVARAEIRMANEIDAAQARGEVAKPGGDRQSIVRDADNGSATFDDLDLDRRRVSEWRQLRDAGGEALVERVVQNALSEGRAPSMGNVHTEVRNVIYVTRPEPSPSRPMSYVYATPEKDQENAIWSSICYGILNERNIRLDPVKAAAVVPADKNLWASYQVARQITWLSQFTDALIEDVEKSLPEDCAPVEENARSR